MAKVIPFHIPANFGKAAKPVPRKTSGKLIEFSREAKKPA